VAAGTLVIDYKMEGSIFTKRGFSSRTHVEDFSLKTKASLKERAPVTFSKAKKSPLVMLSDQEKREGLAAPKP
jgi:hypothetical protein